MGSDQAALKQRNEEYRKNGFAEWLDMPMTKAMVSMTKAMVSMIPPGPQPDHVRLVLEAAYEAGFNAGGGAFAVELLGSMTKKSQR